MFNNQTAEIDLDEDEVPEKDDFFEKNNAYEFSMKLPVKTHIYKIEDSIKDVQKGLMSSSNELDVLNENLNTFSTKIKNSLDEFSKGFYPEIAKLNKEVKRIMDIENNELAILKKQTYQLSQERIKLQNDTLVLENKVVESDKDLGFKHKLSGNKN